MNCHEFKFVVRTWSKWIDPVSYEVDWGVRSMWIESRSSADRPYIMTQWHSHLLVRNLSLQVHVVYNVTYTLVNCATIVFMNLKNGLEHKHRQPYFQHQNSCSIQSSLSMSAMQATISNRQMYRNNTITPDLLHIHISTIVSMTKQSIYSNCVMEIGKVKEHTLSSDIMVQPLIL